MSEREPRPSFSPGSSESEPAPISYLYGEQQPMKKPEVIETPGGTFAFYTDEGIGYTKPQNEDAILVNPRFQGANVVDGMGGHKNGAEAARITALTMNEAIEQRMSFEEAHERTSLTLAKYLNDRDSGACYAAFYRDKKMLHLAHAGDVRLFVIEPNGKAFYSTVDHLGKDENGKTILTNAVNGHPGATRTVTQDLEIVSNIRILLLTDGATKNFKNNDEIADLIKGLPPLEAVEKISHTVQGKMQQRVEGKLSKHEARCDNFSVLIYEPTL